MQPRHFDTSAYAFAQWMAAIIEIKNAKRLLLKAFFAIRTVSVVASAVTVGLARARDVDAGMLCCSREARASDSTQRKIGVV